MELAEAEVEAENDNGARGIVVAVLSDFGNDHRGTVSHCNLAVVAGPDYIGSSKDADFSTRSIGCSGLEALNIHSHIYRMMGFGTGRAAIG